MHTLEDAEQTYASVRTWYETRTLKEAERICDHALMEDARQADLLHVRGLLAAKDGRPDFALRCLLHAVALRPDDPQYLADLGDQLLRQGLHRDAERVCRRALRLSPGDGHLWTRLAVALAEQRSLDEALAAAEQAAALGSTHPRTHIELGNVMQRAGRSEAALRHYRRAADLDDANAEAHVCLGRAHLSRREWALADAAFRRALLADGESADAHCGLGEARMAAGALDEAIEAFRAALAIEPRHVQACRQLVCVLELTRPRDAANAWCALGEALAAHARHQEAIVAYRETLKRKASHLGARVGLARACHQVGDLSGAVQHFEGVLAQEPEHCDAHLGMGAVSALLGNLGRVWDERAWFDQHGPWMQRHFAPPAWDGAPLEGRRILLWTNAGIADTLLMIRFAQLAHDRGGRVIVECERDLASLFERMACIERVVVRRTPIPRFDVHALLASVPRVLGIELDTVPNRVPYLSVDPVLREIWAGRLGETEPPAEAKPAAEARPPGETWTRGETPWPRETQQRDEPSPLDGATPVGETPPPGAPRPLRVGLVWADDEPDADARVRSASLAAFAPLARATGVRFISLQFGSRGAELVAPPPGLHGQRVAPAPAHAADLAALIVNLDLIVTVDSTVAHLAGALARPVWVLLPRIPPGLWQIEGDRTPWYPTMRLFRQRRVGDWSSVLLEVAAALEALPPRPE